MTLLLAWIAIVLVPGLDVKCSGNSHTFALGFAFSSSSRTRTRTKTTTRTTTRTTRIGNNGYTQLFLSDEIKQYRKGLSQIHKDPDEAATTTKAAAAAAAADTTTTGKGEEDVSSSSSGSGGSGSSRDVSCVFKFGGSSLANADRIDHVAKLIRDQIRAGYKPRAVVCSAMGKTTNNLLSAGEEALINGTVSIETIRDLHTSALDAFGVPSDSPTRHAVEELLDECESLLTGVSLIRELSPRSLDKLVSYGERCSVRIVAERLNQIGVVVGGGVGAVAMDAWDAGIVTDDNFGDARLVQPLSDDSIRAAFSKIGNNNNNNNDDDDNDDDDNNNNNTDVAITIAVVTGFLGRHEPSDSITTLGRGGSDLTATALGAALGVDEIQVWKDVDGILTADPRIVPNAKPLAFVSFEEASELAYFGAQVLHPIAMQPAKKSGVPVRVKNSYNPSEQSEDENKNDNDDNNNDDDDRLVTAITYKKGVTVLDISSTQMLGAYGFLARVFQSFATHKLSVDVLASSEVSVSLTLDNKQEEASIAALVEDLGDCSTVDRKGGNSDGDEGRSILTLILPDIHRSSCVLATAFSVFSEEQISVEMMSQGASKVNISFIVRSDCLERAMTRLHECYFEQPPQPKSKPQEQ
eukprot:jgi/Psemu1/255806/estExt_Genewise1Plus.C_1550033